MKIAVFHELPEGGARRAINEFCKQLKITNLVDLFLVDEEENLSEKKFYSNIFFHRFIPKKWVGHNWTIRFYKDTIELIKLYFLNKKIARQIDNEKYDIVLVSASRYIEAPFIMRFLQTPFVFFIHDPFYRIIYDSMLKISKKLDIIRYNYERFNRLLRKVLDKQNIERAKLCIVPSRFIANLFSKTYKKNCKVVYYGVDTDFFKPSNTTKNNDIFYVGSRDPIDGYSLVEGLVKYMQIKPKIKTLFAEEAWISDDKELLRLYQRSKILLATAYNEGLGAVPLEAMSCGVPVVATNEAGHKETVLNGKTGFLLPRNHKIFAKKLEEILLDKNKLKKMSKYARQDMMRNWSWRERSRELQDIFMNYLKEK